MCAAVLQCCRDPASDQPGVGLHAEARRHRWRNSHE
jgi:hypothetical protein